MLRLYSLTLISATMMMMMMMTMMASAFSPTPVATRQSMTMTLMATTETKKNTVERRAILANAAAAATALLWFGGAPPALALNNIPTDNEIVKEQRTVVNQLDVNNAPVADYMKYPGLYPTIAGKIASHGPYQNFSDVYKLSMLSKEEKAKIKFYEKEFTATPATGLDILRGRDPYRRSFNDFYEVKSNVVN
jgi:photosystem II PsbU protein